jgi:hypothetical protein
MVFTNWVKLGCPIDLQALLECENTAEEIRLGERAPSSRKHHPKEGEGER